MEDKHFNAPENQLRVGDAIRCHDMHDLIVTAEELTKQGYKVKGNFRDGDKVIYRMVITAVPRT